MAASSTKLMGAGFPALQATLVGNTVSTIAGVGTAQVGAKSITFNTNRLTTSSGQTAFIVSTDWAIGDQVYCYNTTSTAALIYPPVGSAFDGGSTNASISLAQYENVVLTRLTSTNWGTSQTTVDISGNAVIGGTLSVTGATTLSSTLAAGTTTITSTSASALTVGANGATNPVLKVNANTASVATGLHVTGAAAAGGLAVAVISSGTDESLTLDAKGTGTVTINGSATGAITLARATGVTGAVTVTSAAAAALAVGANGNTNPVLRVVASTGSVATGLAVTGAAAAGGLAVGVLSSGADESMTVDAKGAGTITLNGTATGNIVLGRAATGVSLGVTGALTARSATATPAAESAVPALLFSTTSLLGIFWGSGTPHTALTAAKGSLYLATDGSSSSTRAFVCDGTTNWIAVTTAS